MSYEVLKFESWERPGSTPPCRIEAGLDQISLAQKLDKPQSFVSKFETGERRLDIIELRIICNCMGMTLIEFAEKLEKEIPTG